MSDSQKHSRISQSLGNYNQGKTADLYSQPDNGNLDRLWTGNSSKFGKNLNQKQDYQVSNPSNGFTAVPITSTLPYKKQTPDSLNGVQTSYQMINGRSLALDYPEASSTHFKRNQGVLLHDASTLQYQTLNCFNDQRHGQIALAGQITSHSQQSEYSCGTTAGPLTDRRSCGVSLHPNTCKQQLSVGKRLKQQKQRSGASAQMERFQVINEGFASPKDSFIKKAIPASTGYKSQRNRASKESSPNQSQSQHCKEGSYSRQKSLLFQKGSEERSGRKLKSANQQVQVNKVIKIEDLQRLRDIIFQLNCKDYSVPIGPKSKLNQPSVVWQGEMCNIKLSKPRRNQDCCEKGQGLSNQSSALTTSVEDVGNPIDQQKGANLLSQLHHHLQSVGQRTSSIFHDQFRESPCQYLLEKPERLLTTMQPAPCLAMDTSLGSAVVESMATSEPEHGSVTEHDFKSNGTTPQSLFLKNEVTMGPGPIGERLSQFNRVVNLQNYDFKMLQSLSSDGGPLDLVNHERDRYVFENSQQKGPFYLESPIPLHAQSLNQDTSCLNPFLGGHQVSKSLSPPKIWEQQSQKKNLKCGIKDEKKSRSIESHGTYSEPSMQVLTVRQAEKPCIDLELIKCLSRLSGRNAQSNSHQNQQQLVNSAQLPLCLTQSRSRQKHDIKLENGEVGCFTSRTDEFFTPEDNISYKLNKSHNNTTNQTFHDLGPADPNKQLSQASLKQMLQQLIKQHQLERGTLLEPQTQQCQRNAINIGFNYQTSASRQNPLTSTKKAEMDSLHSMKEFLKMELKALDVREVFVSTDTLSHVAVDQKIKQQGTQNSNKSQSIHEKSGIDLRTQLLSLNPDETEEFVMKDYDAYQSQRKRSLVKSSEKQVVIKLSDLNSILEEESSFRDRDGLNYKSSIGADQNSYFTALSQNPYRTVIDQSYQQNRQSKAPSSDQITVFDINDHSSATPQTFHQQQHYFGLTFKNPSSEPHDQSNFDHQEEQLFNNDEMYCSSHTLTSRLHTIHELQNQEESSKSRSSQSLMHFKGKAQSKLHSSFILENDQSKASQLSNSQLSFDKAGDRQDLQKSFEQKQDALFLKRRFSLPPNQIQIEHRMEQHLPLSEKSPDEPLQGVGNGSQPNNQSPYQSQYELHDYWTGLQSTAKFEAKLGLSSSKKGNLGVLQKSPILSSQNRGFSGRSPQDLVLTFTPQVQNIFADIQIVQPQPQVLQTLSKTTTTKFSDREESQLRNKNMQALSHSPRKEETMRKPMIFSYLGGKSEETLMKNKIKPKEKQMRQCATARGLLGTKKTEKHTLQQNTTNTSKKAFEARHQKIKSSKFEEKVRAYKHSAGLSKDLEIVKIDVTQKIVQKSCQNLGATRTSSPKYILSQVNEAGFSNAGKPAFQTIDVHSTNSSKTTQPSILDKIRANIGQSKAFQSSQASQLPQTEKKLKESTSAKKMNTKLQINLVKRRQEAIASLPLSPHPVSPLSQFRTFTETKNLHHLTKDPQTQPTQRDDLSSQRISFDNSRIQKTEALTQRDPGGRTSKKHPTSSSSSSSKRHHPNMLYSIHQRDLKREEEKIQYLSQSTALSRKNALSNRVQRRFAQPDN